MSIKMSGLRSMDKAQETRPRTAAHYFLEGLEQLGVQRLFCNLGTDHAPLIEEMARWEQEGRSPPATILCPHENTAVHMAAGYAHATGKGQVAVVHVDAGTSNAAMGLHNAYRARLPLMLLAGRAPYTMRGELPGSRDVYVHFVQDPFDQASVVRPYIKWEYTLPTGIVAKEALRRAKTVMESDPKGPVYMMLPRETLSEETAFKGDCGFSEEAYGPTPEGGADSELVDKLVDQVLAAESPLLITSYAGRNEECFEVMREFIEFTGTRAFESNPLHACIPHDSACFSGHDASSHVPHADLGLLIDVDVPWIPKHTEVSSSTYWVHIDVDTVKEGFPMWGFPSHLRGRANSAYVLRQVLDELRKRASLTYREKAARRVEVLRDEAAKRRSAIQERAREPGQVNRLSAAHVLAVLNSLLDPEDIVVNEAVRNAGTVLEQMPRIRAKSLVGLAGGGLGFSGGMALGVRLARPERTVVNIVGDGAFYFNNPSSVYAVAKQYETPIFTVVLDNSGWAAVRHATLSMYPEGVARARDNFRSLLAPDMDFAGIGRAAGAYGEKLADPGEVSASMRRCLAAVRAGRSAVLHVRMAPI